MENGKIDLRKISQQKLQQLKRNAIKLREEGIANKEVAQKLNLNPTVLSRWYQKYLQNDSQVKVLKRGRKQGTQKKLTNEQERMTINRLQKTQALLDKKLVKNIMDELYNIQIPLTTVSDYLKKWGISSSLIKEFESDFINYHGIESFQSAKQKIIKRQGIIIWVVIVEYELETNKKIYSILTRFIKNKLIFKIYETQVEAVDVVKFVNQLSTSFTKHLYAILDTKYIEVIDSSLFVNSEKVTFIYD